MGRDGDGISITERSPGRWRYVVRDRAGQRKTKTFQRDPVADGNRRKAGCAAGDTWAKYKRASFSLGLDSAAKLDLNTLRDAYIEHRRQQGCGASQLGIVANAALRAAEAGVSSLDDPRIAAKVTSYLSGYLARRHNQRTPKPATPRTKNKVIVALRSLGNFAIRNGMSLRNPFAALDPFPESRRAKPTYTIDELRRMVSDTNSADPWWRFIILATYTGARSETVRNLTWGMVDWAANRIRIPAEIMKCANDVRVPIQPELAEILKGMPMGFPHSTILPTCQAGMTSDRANEMTQTYLRRLGINPGGRSVHALRHSVGGLLTATGLGVFSAMDVLGHTSTQTSRHYAATADLYREQVMKEGWLEGEMFLRRTPPAQRAGTAL